MRRSTSQAFIGVTTILALLVGGPARAANILLSFDAECTTCSLRNVTPGTFFTLYVTASEVGGIWEGYGVGGAEFRIVGVPAGFSVVARTTNPNANIVLGDPLGAGTDIALFPGGSGACISLFTFTFVATELLQDVRLRVERHSQPSNPFLFDCPVLAYSDCGPKPGSNRSICLQCVGSSEAVVNPTGPDCTVAVRWTSWAGLKQLYE
jgi:hypothetical protein